MLEAPEPGSLRKSPPVVDVRNGNVVKTAGYAVHFVGAHHRHIDYLCHPRRHDAAKIASVACVFGIGKERYFASIAFVIVIAPDQFPHERRSNHRFGVVTIPRNDRKQLISLRIRTIASLFDTISSRSQTTIRERGCPAATSPSTMALTTSRCVVKSGPPAVEILFQPCPMVPPEIARPFRRPTVR